MTPEDVSFAIQAACRETGADPEAVRRGDEDRPGGANGAFKLARARAYAAWALHTTRAARVTYIARMVGVKPASQQSYVSNVIYKRKTHWWDEDAEARVIYAVKNHYLLEVPPPKPPKPRAMRWPKLLSPAASKVVSVETEEPYGPSYFRAAPRPSLPPDLARKLREAVPAKFTTINKPKSKVLGKVVTDEVLNS